MRAGGVAIVFGAAIGVIAAAVVRNGTAPQATAAGTLRAATSTSAPASSLSPSAGAETPSSSTASAAATTASTASGPGVVAASSAATAPAGTAGSSTSVAELPLAPALPPVTSAAELANAEVRCYETDPEECGRAADGYDLGKLVPRDIARAARLRRIELTRLVRRCEQRSPHACLVLAGRYAAGQGVTENERHARALLDHARELCRRRASAECNGTEPK